MLVDSNCFVKMVFLPVCLINLSKLSKGLLNILNKNNYEKIIIISCHHDDFWNKINILKNYIIKNRRYFICEKLKYFITVSVFIKKLIY